MSLRRKFVLIFAVALAFISATTYVLLSLVIANGANDIEQRIVSANLLRISNAVQHEQDHLDGIANDYANWDSTYEFLRGGYPRYGSEEISDESFGVHRVDVFVLLDKGANSSLCRQFRNSNGTCDPSTFSELSNAVRRLRGGKGEAHSGLIIVGGQPMQVSIRPVLRTDLSGPSAGELIMGRWLDEQEVRVIAKMLALPMTAIIANSAGIRRHNGEPIQAEKQWYLVNPETITGYVRLNDLFGGPGIVLTTQFRRDLTRKGRIIQRWLFLEILVVAVALLAVGFYLLQRIILWRVGRLGATAAAISRTGDLSHRVPVNENDEITELELAFNTMVQDLEESKRELLLAQENLEYNATHDPLTGVLNRAAVMRQLRAEMSRAQREGGSFGLMLIDLDHFKSVNDTFGHATGDEVLKAVIASVVLGLRPYDVVGRYGGEEFLVIVPGCGEQETLVIAERVRAGVEALGAVPPVTVSIGVTSCGGGRSESELLAEVDVSLYSAKQSGRNRVEGWTPAPSGESPGVARSTLL